MNIIKALSTLATLIVLSLSLSACHTANGFGQDLQSGGKAISNAATSDS